MKKLPKLLFATLLTAAAILSMPPKASASVVCDQCAATGDCNACCRCAGHGPGYCTVFCNGV